VRLACNVWNASGYDPALAEEVTMGQGSTGNVIAALCSFFVPGLGQLIQGRILAAAIQFVLAGILWFVLLGWVVHLWSIVDAARWKGRL
jgi:TM2 domain-containing membrane protein YozV